MNKTSFLATINFSFMTNYILQITLKIFSQIHALCDRIGRLTQLAANPDHIARNEHLR